MQWKYCYSWRASLPSRYNWRSKSSLKPLPTLPLCCGRLCGVGSPLCLLPAPRAAPQQHSPRGLPRSLAMYEKSIWKDSKNQSLKASSPEFPPTSLFWAMPPPPCSGCLVPLSGPWAQRKPPSKKTKSFQQNIPCRYLISWIWDWAMITTMQAKRNRAAHLMTLFVVFQISRPKSNNRVSLNLVLGVWLSCCLTRGLRPTERTARVVA